jgi:hypothetical protein
MASGFLYSKVQPFQKDDFFLKTLEQDRALRIATAVKKQQKKQEAFLNLFKDLESPDVEGKFLQDSIKGMEEVKRSKIDAWKLYDSGKLTETDHILVQSQLDRIPLKYQAAQETINKKLKELADGDDVMNKSTLEEIALLTSTYETKFNPKTRGIDVSYKSVDDEGKVQTITEPVDTLINRIQGLQGVEKIEDPLDELNKGFVNFQTATREGLVGEDMSIVQSGMGVGETRNKFDNTFKAIVGGREDFNNLGIQKRIVQKYGDIPMGDEDFEELYKKEWDELYELKKGVIKDEYREKKRSTSDSGADKTLDKLRISIIENKDGTPLTSIKTTSGESVGNGLGITVHTPATDEKLSVSTNDLEGVSTLENFNRNVQVEALYVTPDDRVFGKISVDHLSLLAAAKLKELDGAKDAYEKKKELNQSITESTAKLEDWVEITGISKSKVASDMSGGKKPKNLFSYANEQIGGEQQETKTEEKKAMFD